MAAILPLFNLTPMTGRTAGSDRTTVIWTVEVRWRTLWISVIGGAPGALLAAMLWPLIDAWSLLIVGLSVAAAFFLIERRTSDGLRLRTYQDLMDRRKSTKGRFYLCFQEIDPFSRQFRIIRRVSMEVDDEPRGAQELF